MRLLREVKMRTVMLASVMAVLVAGSAMGQSVVAFELELGGDNHGVGCVGPGTAFTSGTTAETEVYAPGTQITWAARLSAAGTQVGGNGSGFACKGAANIVFDLELRQGTEAGPLMPVTFYSTANDGVGGCPNSAAAMTVKVNPFNLGPGRLIDPLTGGAFTGGVHMDVHTYPTAEPGTLLGMGCGYHNWSRSGGGATMTVAGVGQTSGGDPTAGPLGVGPFFEGQIDTTGLAPGTYVLKLIPGAGVNVLRGDINLGANQEAFATAANQTVGDTITFTIGDSCAVQTLDWRSVRLHNGNPLAIALDASATSGGTATSEPRRFGVMQIEVDFDVDVTSCYTAGQVSAGGLTVTNDQLINGGTTLQIDVTGSADESCYLIDISNSVAGIINDADCYVATLEADSNNDNAANFIDVSQVKSLAGQPAANNPRADYNTDGSIDFIDVSAVKSLTGASVVCP